MAIGVLDTKPEWMYVKPTLVGYLSIAVFGLTDESFILVAPLSPPMLTATIHIDLDSDYVLSDLKAIHDEPFTIYQFEIIDGEIIKFVINAGDHRDAIATVLRESDAVEALEYVADSQLLITKRSSGILPIIRENHGMLRRMNQFDGTRRVYDIVVFDRDDLKTITEELRELGTVRLERLKPFADPTSSLSARQAEVLELAYEAGYFDWPRRTDVETLADRLDISHPTVLEHLRKAEKKIIDEALSRAAPTTEIIPEAGY
ncbi:MAG TPA: helix-turn-helix domain-containing protein [Halococcus sp.]|nr:helix-turn-helix domain-containing protein [Halococcus sp.]